MQTRRLDYLPAVIAQMAERLRRPLEGPASQGGRDVDHRGVLPAGCFHRRRRRRSYHLPGDEAIAW
jgi:hypothetical protein